MTTNSNILSKFASIVDRFRKLHSPVEQFVVVIGTILTPVYFIENRVADLLFAIQSAANGKELNLLLLTILCIQTVLVFYNLGLLINFFFSKSAAVSQQDHGRYEGVHPALEFTILPRYLIAPEIEPSQDTIILEQEVAANIRTIEEVLGEDISPQEFSSAESIIDYYTKLYGEEDVEAKKQTVSLADQLRSKGVDIDELLKD